MKVLEMPKLAMDKLAASEVACQAMCEVAQRDPTVWLLTADVARPTRSVAFGKAYPDRFVNVGIAEQTTVAMAAGLATCGKVPVVVAFAPMLTMRACEQIRTSVAYPNLNVKIIGAYAGLSSGHSGPSHHAVEDIAILRSMANMVVIVPCDARETRAAMLAALEREGPVYLRLGRANEPTVYPDALEYQIGRAVLVREGSDVTLIGCGRTVVECMVAAALLQEKGVSARVLDMHTVKPIDAEAIGRAAAQTRRVFTVEEHNVIGGLGGAVAEVMAELGSSVPLKRVGIPDVFAVVGPPEALLDRYGLTGPRIAEAVLRGLS